MLSQQLNAGSLPSLFPFRNTSDTTILQFVAVRYFFTLAQLFHRPQNRVLLNVPSMVGLSREPGVDSLAGARALEVARESMRVDGTEQALKVPGGFGASLWVLSRLNDG